MFLFVATQIKSCQLFLDRTFLPPAPTRCLSSSPSCGCIPSSAPFQPLSQTVLLRNYPGLEELEHCVITQCDCSNPDGALKGEGRNRVCRRLRGSFFSFLQALLQTHFCEAPRAAFPAGKGDYFRVTKIGFFQKLLALSQPCFCWSRCRVHTIR